MAVEATGSVEVFFSYDQEDEPLQKRLEKQLHFLKRQGLISAWHNRALLAGQEVDSEIKKHLETAHIILLLISPDFLSSDYCCKVEVAEAMRRHESGEAHVIPIILRHVYWQDEPFNRLQVLPTGGKPVLSWSDIDEAFWDIADNIQQVVKKLLLDRCLNLIEKLCQENRHEEAFHICEQAHRLTINNLLTDERERRVVYLHFHCNLKPREIMRYCPGEFGSEEEIYRLKRNIMERIMRNVNKIRWHLGGDPRS